MKGPARVITSYLERSPLLRTFSSGLQRVALRNHCFVSRGRSRASSNDEDAVLLRIERNLRAASRGIVKVESISRAVACADWLIREIESALDIGSIHSARR